MSTARLFAITMAAALAIGAGKPTPKVNWNAAVVARPDGTHLVGNPAAKVKVVEYVSYTCSHCAAFEKEGSGEIAMGLVKPGSGSVEYRPFLRNVIDVAAALMVNCGSPGKFQQNHAVVLRTQDKWLKAPSPAQEQRWSYGPFANRMRAIAGDLNLYALFEARGYSRVQLDRCLANEAMGDAMARDTKAAINTIGVIGTPSFVINGELQQVYDWASLRPILMQATR